MQAFWVNCPKRSQKKGTESLKVLVIYCNFLKNFKYLDLPNFVFVAMYSFS